MKKAIFLFCINTLITNYAIYGMDIHNQNNIIDMVWSNLGKFNQYHIPSTPIQQSDNVTHNKKRKLSLELEEKTTKKNISLKIDISCECEKYKISAEINCKKDVKNLATKLLSHTYKKSHNGKKFDQINEALDSKIKLNQFKYNLTCELCKKEVNNVKKSTTKINYIQHRYGTKIHNKKEYKIILECIKNLLKEKNVLFEELEN